MTRKILIFAAVIIGIIVDYYVACEFQHIAMEKGFSDRKYFWYTFLLGMIGILMIVFTFRRIIICSGRVCGSLNSSDSICCEKCHRGKNYFSGIDNEALRNRLEDETKKQEFDTKAKKKNKTIMIGIAGIVILIAIIAGILIYPKTVVSKIKTGMAGRAYKSAEDIPGEEEFYFECKEDGTLIYRYRFYMPVLNWFCDWVEQKGSYEIINDGFNYYMNIAGMDMCNGYTGLYEFDSNGTPLYFIYGGNKYVLYK